MDGIRELELENIEAVKVLYGELNSNLKEIENEFDISIHTRGNKITLKGNEERTAEAGMLMAAFRVVLPTAGCARPPASERILLRG